ncbi:MAG: phage major capsid protein [Pirellulaceae bacterium]
MLEPLMIRESPDQRRDITTRSFQVRASTVNEQERTVEATISTESPVEVYDWRSGNVIEEVLLAETAAIPSQMPMLANHSRWSLDDVIGSIRDIRIESGAIVGRLYFADDPDAMRAWNKVRDGHITDVSVGYRVTEAVEIQPGTSTNVNGRTFKAGKRTLRVATNWTPKEGSLVPIGADQAAKIREESTLLQRKDHLMHPKLRAYLESIGLRHDASEDEAQAFHTALTPEQRAAADLAVRAGDPPQQRQADPPVNTPDDPVTPEAAAQRAVTAERERVRAISKLAGADVPAEVRQQAIDEGWDESRASREFLTAVRAQRQTAPAPYHATGGSGPSSNLTARAVAAGLMLANGTNDPTTCVMHNGRRDPLPSDRLTAQDAEQGQRLQRMSAVDLVRQCALLDTGRLHWDVADAFEALRSAPSGGSLSYVFTTSVYAKLMEGWGEVADTTVWCDEEDVANFLTQEDISLSADARLKQLPRGDTAKDATIADARETYKIARYARKWTTDEQDVLDDRLGAIMRMPTEMGSAARRLRPDLVYSLFLANAALADTGALFNSTAVTTAGGHANLTTATLTGTGMKAAILAMGKYREADGTVLNIKPRYLIVPSALQWAAKELLTSTALAYTAAAAAATPSLYYPINVIAAENLTLVVDDRIGAAGVTDPTTNTARTGLDTNWFLSAGGPRTVRVAYRRGTNRQPQLRSFMLDRGQWGMGWDVNMDIGVKALDYRGLHKSTGAG